MLLRLLVLAHALVELAEAEVAVCDEGAQPMCPLGFERAFEARWVRGPSAACWLRNRERRSPTSAEWNQPRVEARRAVGDRRRQVQRDAERVAAPGSQGTCGDRASRSVARARSCRERLARHAEVALEGAAAPRGDDDNAGARLADDPAVLERLDP